MMRRNTEPCTNARDDVHEFPVHEELEHGATEGVDKCCDVVERHTHEGGIWPEPAIGDKQVQVRVPVGQRAVGLDGRDYSLTPPSGHSLDPPDSPSVPEGRRPGKS